AVEEDGSLTIGRLSGGVGLSASQPVGEHVRRQIRDGAGVGVPGPTIGAGSDGVDERWTTVLSMRLLEGLEALGSLHGEVQCPTPKVCGVDVAVGDGPLRRPGQTRQVDDWTVMGAVQRARYLGERSIGLPNIDGDRALVHRTGRAVVKVGRGIAGSELQRIEGDAATRGDGMGPGHVSVEPDSDAGASDDTNAVDVEVTGYGEVLLPEALSAGPEPVWVGKEHAATLLGAFRADRPGIACGREALTVWAERERGGEWRGPGRRRGRDLHHESSGKPPAPREIDRCDWPHPGLSSTPAGDAVDGRLGEVAVVAVCIADDHSPHLGRCGLEAESARVLRAVRTCHDIAGEVDIP